MIRIIDTYEEIRKLLAHGSFDRNRWEEYIKTVSPELLDRLKEDSAGYDFESQILPVLNGVFARPERAEEAHRSFQKVTKKLCLRQVDSAVVFYLGLCNGAGWATELEGKPAVLLGLEKIVELGWGDERNMIGLVYHELGHNWHFQNRHAKAWGGTPKEKALWQLYTEGVAMCFEQNLCGEPHFYHQDRGGWLNWCRGHESMLAAAYRDRLETGDVQDFFGDWCSFEGRSDTGYYLGGELVRAAWREHGGEFVLNMTSSDVLSYLERM